MEKTQYIALEDASERLGVKTASLHYYARVLGIKKHKFPLDRRVYLTLADFERIKGLKDQAMARGGTRAKEEVA